jgi:hypothetical protein
MFAAYAAARRRAADSGKVLWSGSGRALGAWFGLVLAIALLRWIGFALSFVLLTIFLLVGLERRPAPLAVVVGIALAAAFHLTFVIALGVSLPAGPWGF